MRSSSNPAFRNLPRGAAATGQYGPNVGFDQPYGQPQGQGGVPGYGPGQMGTASADRPMTVDDVVIKTGMSLGVALVVGVLTAIWAQSQLVRDSLGRLSPSGPLLGALIGGLVVGLVVSLVIIFKQKPSGPLTLVYSGAEGLFLGALSGLFEVFLPGIALQALIGTAGVFVAMLVVYKTGAVKVTPKLTKWIVGAVAGVAILMLVNLVTAVFFGFNPLRDGSPLAIVFSLVVIGIAAFSFLLDFDQADKMIRAGMPSKWAWYAAFGLMTTLVWLYLEILRLLSYLRD
ncbi:MULTISPECIES: Bax inhibitor-1/YccA family protein [Amycolatopsis]|uniref:Bax inhibitor-1/YccA family protein n=2 Tax=Amycolatopsis TaxID=1813 RepID=A0A7W3VT48_9PSEU|nr:MULTISPECIES: Bax inhibitor-1/YccA family protein [Amycolatopsis]MBB1152736.1 Bax inhibitor-1/YccA family protein [Amycolatopsis dendrobii]UKD52087.1 Bax inhibitor-1/YccA family protein [Amycolatopsis sp. FU40]